MRLDRYKRNQIIEAWKEAGLDPMDFELGNNDEDDVAVRVSHRRSESRFIVGGTYGHYVGHRVVGDGPEEPYEAYSWPPVMERVGRWISAVKLDLETPNLWEEIQRAREMLGAGPAVAVENTPFTPDEQKQIAERLEEVKEYVAKTYELSEDQKQALEAGFASLQEAATSLRRETWRTLALGTVINLMLTAALSPEAARGILQALLRSVGHLFGHPFLELPGGT